jgi:hypothetical protein
MGGSTNPPSPSNVNGCVPGNTACNGYPYGNGGLMRRQFTQSAKVPPQPWCSSKENIANMQYNTYHFPAIDSNGIHSTKILSSNTQFLGICGAVFSPNQYFMLLQQDDGNLNLWDVSLMDHPVLRWSSETTAPGSTWKEKDSRLANGTWTPAYHVGTFLGKKGAKLLKVEEKENGGVKVSNIDPSLNGKLLEPTTIPNSFLVLRNSGDLIQTADGRTNSIYKSPSAPTFAPIRVNRNSKGIIQTFCLTALPNSGTSFETCKQNSNQRWTLHQGHVYNWGTKRCLEIGAKNSPLNKKCNLSKKSQKWQWSFGRLSSSAVKFQPCLNSIWNGNSYQSTIGHCNEGPRMNWNN